MRTLLFLATFLPCLASQVIGISTVASVSTQRTVVVDQGGTGNHTTIQGAFNAALPGDMIQIRAGAYTEAPILSRSGTSSRGIVITNYPGEFPILHPPGDTEASNCLTFTGRWIIVSANLDKDHLTGIECTGAWNGVYNNGANNMVSGMWIHDNGTSMCALTQFCGQGILSTRGDLVVLKNVIERNGITNFSPWHVHGIYLSDFFGCNCVNNTSIIGNTIQDHGGAGVHAFDPTRIKTGILIQGNTLRRNGFEIITVKAANVQVAGNNLEHDPALTPPGNGATFDALVWAEFTNGFSVAGNTVKQMIGTTSDLVHAPNIGSLSGFAFLTNIWDIPGHEYVTDDLLNGVLP